jgi:hypothetical protein
MKEVSPEEALMAAKDEEDAKKVSQRRKDEVLHAVRGFSSEGQEYDAYG